MLKTVSLTSLELLGKVGLSYMPCILIQFISGRTRTCC